MNHINRLVKMAFFLMFEATGDKLLINKFVRQNFGGGLTLKKSYILNVWELIPLKLPESLGNGGSATRLFLV